ncbi:MAG: hypothetical protein E4H24_04660 [Thermomicrobiales bacterium]|nr:MAG: hypothetical protein E4H24_04660 [Thermomicrobiales bacterium]
MARSSTRETEISHETPDQEPPLGPPSEPTVPEPDAETARVPIDPLTPPATGLISAKPVGWTSPADESSAGAPGATPPESSDAPPAGWTPPVPQAALSGAEGMVISGVFSRAVAYAIDVSMLASLNFGVQWALGLFSEARDETLFLIVTAVLITFDLIYFVGLWTSGWHATLGMRLMRLRILGAVNAGTLSFNDALLRWLALTGAITILAVVPSIASTIGFISLVWVVVLLLTTVMNPLRQGLHDRWARSVVVQPAPGGSGVAVIGCLVLTVVLFVVVPIGLLLLAGDQVRDLLIDIGNSV